MRNSSKKFIRIASLFLFSIFFILCSCGGGGDSSGGSGSAPSASKDITAFNFLAAENVAISADVTGTVNATTVGLTVPYGTVVGALVPDIAITGASVYPSDGAAVDFSSPVTYTVTADDGTTKDYTVTVTIALNDAKDITAFNFLAAENVAISADVTGTVNATTVGLTVPYGTDVSALVPDIAITGVSVYPADGAAVDFSSPVTYTVTADDATTKDYTVTVTVAARLPVAHWMFDEGTDITASDSSGSGYDGTLMGAPLPQWITGRVGDYALDFSGSSDYISVTHDTVFNSQDFTITAWLANYSPDTTSAYFRRIGGWHIRTTASGWDFFMEGGGDTVLSGYNFPEYPPGAPEWHHYAITVSNTLKEVIFYVDGVQEGTVHTYTNGFPDPLPTGDLYIGQYNPSYNWSGAMDDVRFYNEVLTAKEVSDLYDSYPTIP